MGGRLTQHPIQHIVVARGLPVKQFLGDKSVKSGHLKRITQNNCINSRDQQHLGDRPIRQQELGLAGGKVVKIWLKRLGQKSAPMPAGDNWHGG
jgi:hypothetical protein